MSERRRKRGWREQRKYRSERVAIYVALGTAILVVVVTILFARLRREQASVPPVPRISSQSDSSADDQ
jgi:hypothetical protein